ncbi:hypothetical protein Tco_0700237 [Tanacetum coccineum]
MSAIHMNKVPKKLEDLGKFLIPCVLQELDRTSALADFRASINLLPHSIYKQIGLEALNPTQMTLELANRSVTHPMVILLSRNIHCEFTLPNSLPPGDEDSIHKKDIHEEMFQIYSNPLFEFDDNFKSSNVNPLFGEKDKDVEITFSPSLYTLLHRIKSVVNEDADVFLVDPICMENDDSYCDKEEDNLSFSNVLT